MRKYRYTTTESEAKLGRIEQGLGLLGFRVVESTVDFESDGIGPEQVKYSVVFEPGKIGPTGRRLDNDAEINIVQGKIEEAPYA